jgi:hypothetical protein
MLSLEDKKRAVGDKNIQQVIKKHTTGNKKRTIGIS